MFTLLRAIVLPTVVAGSALAPVLGAQWVQRANGAVAFLPIDARLARAALATSNRSVTPVSIPSSSDD
jgi:hypothetical protein